MIKQPIGWKSKDSSRIISEVHSLLFRYGGWADEESSEFGGWGGPTRPKSPPRAAGPAAGAAAAYTPAPLPSRAPTGPKPAIANLPGAAGSALPPIPGRQQQKPAGESYGGWAVVEEGPAGGWADGRGEERVDCLFYFVSQERSLGCYSGQVAIFSQLGASFLEAKFLSWAVVAKGLARGGGGGRDDGKAE
jgi:hypothetical protein